MALFRRGKQPEKDPRPVAVNDFIYDTPDDPDSGASVSETPEEAAHRRLEEPARLLSSKSAGQSPHFRAAEMIRFCAGEQ